MKKRVFLVGGFNKTKLLATSLLKKGYQVVAINSNIEVCQALSEVEKLKVFHGDGAKPFVLEEANIYHADIVVVLTDEDADNLIICQLCKKKFQVKKTVSVISDPRKIDFFHHMGVDSVVCATAVVADMIKHHALLDEMETLMPIGEGDIRIAQMTVSQMAPGVGKSVQQLNLPNEVVISCLMRHNQSMVPYGDTQICAGDNLILTFANKHEKAVLSELSGR